MRKSLEELDTSKIVKNIAAAAAEILAESKFSTNWDDIIPLLDNESISERVRLAAQIIFRAKLVLEEMERNPRINNVVYNMILMMDTLEIANIKGYLSETNYGSYKDLFSIDDSIDSAIKKERIIRTIKELALKNPDKNITLRKKASKIFIKEGLKGYSYRQIMRDTKGFKIN